MFGCIFVEIRGASYRANHNFTIKSSSLNFNSETCIETLWCPKTKRNMNACILKNLKTSFLTALQSIQYFDKNTHIVKLVKIQMLCILICCPIRRNFPSHDIFLSFMFNNVVKSKSYSVERSRCI